MKKLQLFIREEAYSDLENIWNYTMETWSLRQADKYYNDIIEAIEFLCEEPGTGKSEEHIRKGYRSFKINSHLIFYITNDLDLDVIRILHAQMDIPNRLAD
jgi:toxin ParE1/3/4